MDLNNAREISEMDPSGMLEDLQTFPEQVEEGLELGSRTELPYDLKSGDKITLTGMGGSAIVGDLLSRLTNLEVIVNRGYFLPPEANNSDLFVPTSYSGSTEETISALKEGVRRGLPTLSISTGGKVARYCQKNSLPHITIPGGKQPRASTGYMLFPLIQILKEAGLAGTFRPTDLVRTLRRAKGEWGPEVPVEDNLAKQLAGQLKGRLPFIYGTAGNTKAIAYRWKTQINENAKQPASWNVFPELNHNETVGYELGPKIVPNMTVILLKNGLEYYRNSIRIEVMEEILREAEVEYILVEAPGEEKYGKVTGQMYLGDFVSVYLALLNEVDPSPVQLIENFKKKMKRAAGKNL